MNNKLLNIFINAKKSGDYIDSGILSNKLVKIAKDKDQLYSYNKEKGINLCSFKTTYNDEEAIIIVFIIDLPASKRGIGIASELIMSLVDDVYKTFGSIDFSYLNRSLTIENKPVGFLKIIKIISEDDYL